MFVHSRQQKNNLREVFNFDLAGAASERTRAKTVSEKKLIVVSLFDFAFFFCVLWLLSPRNGERSGRNKRQAHSEKKKIKISFCLG